MGRADKRQVEGAQLAMATGFGGCFWSDALIIGAKKP
jgi:acetyl-CoA C-acetyltransferase